MDEGTQGQTTQTEVAPAQRHIIQRPRLYRLLDESNARIILLVAPAGYGKTTLARQWTSLRGRIGLWYASTAGAADPAVLALGIAESIAAISPTASDDVKEYLVATASHGHSPTQLARVLASSITSWPTNVWLVLDDYHFFAGVEDSERLIDELASATDIRLLITSRDMPTWASPRRLLYGQFAEVGADDLAMTDDEVAGVMHFSSKGAAGLREAARGWPAVIGLAALVPQLTDLAAEPEALHGYFTAELLERVSSDLQPQLTLLAMLPTVDLGAARVLLGADAERAINEAVRVGLGSMRDGSLEVHPLIRAFLQSRIERPNDGRLQALATHLFETGNDDVALELIATHRLAESLRELVRRRLIATLEAGLVATVGSWLELADKLSIDGPEFALARAQILLNRGEWPAAEHTAGAASLLLPPSLAEQALVCAGEAAQLMDDRERALAHFDAALRLSESPKTIGRALWGKFIIAMHFPSGDPARALADLEAHPDASPRHLVRRAQARIVQAEHDGALGEAADAALHAEVLLEDVPDPLIRTGFLNNLADALVLSSRYTEAERLARVELSECERFHLDFVYPHAFLILAGAKLGLGDFLGAEALIDEADAVPGPKDSFAVTNALGLRTRLDVSFRRLDDVPTPADVPQDARMNIWGEAVASIALARAVIGDHHRAEALITSMPRERTFCLARVLVAAAHAIAAIDRREAHLAGSVSAFIGTTKRTQAFDGALCAIRGHQALFDAVLHDRDGADLLSSIYRRSGDPSVRDALGLSRPTAARAPMSRRETEVLSLVAQGLRNNEIATRLFISPKTVKTHLQHAFEKLDAHSRTEAVVKAKNAGLL